MMLLSLGTTFMIGVLYINLVTAPISTPILTMKNCTHIEFVTEVSFVIFFHQLIVQAILINFDDVIIGFVGLAGLRVSTVKADGFPNETILTVSPNTIESTTDPFNLTLLFEFPANSTSYQFNFAITNENIREVTDVYKKSECTPSNTSDIVCENSCLCDTVIYKRCANGDRVNGICSDPGTLFQSPGNLTFNGECSPGISPGAIARMVIGVIVGLIIIAAVVYFVLQKKKKVEYPKSAEESPLETTNT